ncbi:MAG: hypothetical protein RL681_5 [Candidatus Parcubacteria bacterium]|jgi:predicted Zn-dependent protease with MMP-like domain
MTLRQFERLVAEEVARIPERFRKDLANVVFVARIKPTTEELREHDVPERDTLLGLFDGVTLGERGSGPWEFPGRIVLFQEPSEDEAAENGMDVREVVRDTIWHEVAHFLGLDEYEVRAAEERRRSRQKKER